MSQLLVNELGNFKIVTLSGETLPELLMTKFDGLDKDGNAEYYIRYEAIYSMQGSLKDSKSKTLILETEEGTSVEEGLFTCIELYKVKDERDIVFNDVEEYDYLSFVEDALRSTDLANQLDNEILVLS